MSGCLKTLASKGWALLWWILGANTQLLLASILLIFSGICLLQLRLMDWGQIRGFTTFVGDSFSLLWMWSFSIFLSFTTLYVYMFWGELLTRCFQVPKKGEKDEHFSSWELGTETVAHPSGRTFFFFYLVNLVNDQIIITLWGFFSSAGMVELTPFIYVVEANLWFTRQFPPAVFCTWNVSRGFLQQEHKISAVRIITP